ncbi:MAG: alpha/beta hydrolase [Rhodospirillaceae bacterium]|nr:alpha/beta hydrolase [Rhodospirillaceae bacterium]|tara:strand:- start:5135 stop:5926 length:792 start_codon:yes stop_codon:yes gene_type:complete
MSDFERKIALVSGRKVSYIEVGFGPALFLMHGIGGNAKSWRAQLENLSSDYHMIAWDAPGYGASDVRDGTLLEYVEAAIGLLDVLGIDRAFVLGHSMGGVIAQGLAGSVPSRVKKLILSSTFMGHGAAEGSPLQDGYLARLHDIETMNPEAFGMARASSMLSESASVELCKEVAGIASQVREDGLRAGCQLLNYADTSRMIVGLEMPVLLIMGKEDVIVKPEKTMQIADVLGDVKHVHLPNTAHAAYLEDPTNYNAILREFLS